MESAASRQEQSKTPQDKVREKFQAVLDAMEQHIKLHPDKYISSTSNRFVFVTTHAEMIYNYYGKPDLISTFKEKLEQYLEIVEKNKTQEKKEDLSTFQILPKLILPNPHTHYAPPAMPFELHGFHDIMSRVIKKATELYNKTYIKSDLKLIMDAASGHEIIAQALATNAYLLVFSSQLTSDAVLLNSVGYGNFLGDCLKERSIYQSDRTQKSTATFPVGSTSKTFSFIICGGKDEAMLYLSKNGYFQGCSFGLEFSFTLKKMNSGETQYAPLLNEDSIVPMEVRNLEGMQSPAMAYLKMDGKTNRFAIVEDPRLNLIKK